MKKVIRLSEKDLTKLIKKVIKESNYEAASQDEISQFDKDFQIINYKLETSTSEPISDLFVDDENENLDQTTPTTSTGQTPTEELRSIIEKKFNKKISKRKKLKKAYEANKEYVDSEREQLMKIFDKHNLCTKDGRKGAVNYLKSKAYEYLQKLPEKENQNIEEQTLIPWSKGQTYLLIATVLVILVLIFWRTVIYGDGCRRYYRRRDSWRY